MTDESISALLTPFHNKVTNVPTADGAISKKGKSRIRHVCHICSKEFTKKCGLTNHLLIHAGVKPFVCEICNKTFTKKCTLTVHLLTHSAERPHKCESCDKSFSRKTDLQNHKLVHSGEKRFVCEICDCKFNHQNNLRRHKLKHLPKEVTDADADKKDGRSLLLTDKNQIIRSLSKVLKDTVNVKNVSEVVKQTLMKRNEEDPFVIEDPTDVSKTNYSGVLVAPNELISVSNNDVMVNEKVGDDINKIKIPLKLENCKNVAELLFTDKEEKAESNDLESINGILNCMVDKVDNLNNSDVSDEVKKALEIKDIYNSLPTCVDNESNLLEINACTLSPNANSCFPQMSLESQIFKELEKLKKVQDSLPNYSRRKRSVSNGSEILEKAIQKKDLCQSLSVDNDLEQALAFVSDVKNADNDVELAFKSNVKNADNDVELPLVSDVKNDVELLLSNVEASQNAISQNEIPKNIAEDIQLLLIPSDTTNVSLNDSQHNLKVLDDSEGLHNQSDVTKLNALDMPLLSLTDKNVQEINSIPDIPESIEECHQGLDHSLKTYVNVQPPNDIDSGLHDGIPLIPASHSDETYVNNDLIFKDAFQCDVCGLHFDDQKDFLLHISSHISEDQKTCYLCDLNLDSNALLREHIMTHYEEDDDDLSLDEDFSKIGPLSPGDILLDDIDKIALDDEDFEEKVARMYALAHVELSDGFDSDSDDEATRLYSYSQVDWGRDNSSDPISCKDSGRGLKSETITSFSMLATSIKMKDDQDKDIHANNNLDNSKLKQVNEVNIQGVEERSKLSSTENCNISESSVVDTYENTVKAKDSKSISLFNKTVKFDTINKSLSLTDNKDLRANQIVKNIITKVDAFLRENISDNEINDILSSSSTIPNSFQLKPVGSDIMNESSVNSMDPIKYNSTDLKLDISDPSESSIQLRYLQPKFDDINITENSSSNIPSSSQDVFVTDVEMNINENSLDKIPSNLCDKNIQPGIVKPISPKLDSNMNKNSGNKIKKSYSKNKDSYLDIKKNSVGNIQCNAFEPKSADSNININENCSSNTQLSTLRPKLSVNYLKENNVLPSSFHSTLKELDSSINENSSNGSVTEDLIDKKKPSFICSFCDKTFTRKRYLHEHYLMHAGIKQFACEVCDKKFTKKCALSIHSLTHTQERKYSCTECDKTFSRKTDYQKHTIIHTGLKPFACDICRKAFNHQNNLRRHKRLHYNNKPFICYICNTGFSERIGLLSHVKVHIKEAEMKSADGKLSENIRNCLNAMKEKLYECGECKMLFARRDRLLKHKLTHTVRNPHTCEICATGFQKRDQLKLHLSTHFENEFENIKVFGGNIEDIEINNLQPTVQPTRKTHTCDRCLKVYAKSSALKCHYLTHTGERPHKCHLCSNAFAQRTNLKRHLLSHAGIKPFKCNICFKNFARKPYLRKHYLSHTSDELFTLLGNLPDE